MSPRKVWESQLLRWKYQNSRNVTLSPCAAMICRKPCTDKIIVDCHVGQRVFLSFYTALFYLCVALLELRQMCGLRTVARGSQGNLLSAAHQTRQDKLSILWSGLGERGVPDWAGEGGGLQV